MIHCVANISVLTLSLLLRPFQMWRGLTYKETGLVKRIRFIIELRKLDVNYVDPETGWSLLHMAVYHCTFCF